MKKLLIIAVIAVATAFTLQSFTTSQEPTINTEDPVMESQMPVQQFFEIYQQMGFPVPNANDYRCYQYPNAYGEWRPMYPNYAEECAYRIGLHFSQFPFRSYVINGYCSNWQPW